MPRPTEKLIYDRTQADVDRAQTLTSKMADGSASPAERAEWLENLKGAYNFTDLNRVEKWSEYLAEQLRLNGYAVDLKPYNVTDSKIETIEHNINDYVNFTGAEQTYTIPLTGKYTVTACGAHGSGGNYRTGGARSVGGKGAKLTATFDFTAGEKLRIVVGGAGKLEGQVNGDGTGGGGGGCTIVMRDIDAVKDNRYQFARPDDTKFEVLMLVAGGGGGNDVGYQSSVVNGADGQAVEFKNLNRFASCSSNTQTTSLMGIWQYISHDAKGYTYSRSSCKAVGGYGCGSASDDGQSYGGGWCTGSASFSANSFCLDEKATGVNGGNSDENGSVLFQLRRTDTETTYFQRSEWLMKDIPYRFEIDRIRRNVEALQKGFYTLPEWRDILFNNTMDFEQANVLEWNMEQIEIWLERMVESFVFCGEFYSGEV